jgi:hypothetical protein
MKKEILEVEPLAGRSPFPFLVILSCRVLIIPFCYMKKSMALNSEYERGMMPVSGTEFYGMTIGWGLIARWRQEFELFLFCLKTTITGFV